MNIVILQGRLQLLNNDTLEISYWGTTPFLGACDACLAAEVPSLRLQPLPCGRQTMDAHTQSTQY